MKIEIKHIKIVNFKGIKSREIDFDDITNIYGTNGTGKTTIFDAFWWLLFGKDSEGKAQFNIKPLDSNNQPLHKADHEVEAVLGVDGTHTHIKRTLREKWVKKRGEQDAVFSGHETGYFWNEVPLKQKEFESKVNGLVSEEMFKLLTSARYFNSLHWEKRREILFDMVEDVTLEDVAGSRDDFQELLGRLSGKSVEDYRRELASKKKKLKEELEKIPTRVDEVNRSMPEPVDEAGLKKRIDQVNNQIAEVDDQLSDVVKANEAANKEIIQKQNRLRELETKRDDLADQAMKNANKGLREYEAKKQELESELSRLRSELSEKEHRQTYLNGTIGNTETEMADLRAEWERVNAEQFEMDEDATTCSQCGQALPKDQQAESREQLQAQFNERKQKRMDAIKNEGNHKKLYKEQLETELVNVEQRIRQLNESIAVSNKSISELHKPEEGQVSEADRKAMDDLNGQIEALQKELETPASTTSDADLKSKRVELQNERDQLKEQLQVTDQIDRAKKRIGELQAQEKELAQQLADMEGDENVIGEMVKARIDAIEGRVNSLFSYVRFKMYEAQINEGEKPTCLTLIDGVPYQDANNAARINAGIDIINTLSGHYGLSAPCFVDNREAIVQLVDTDAQLINLYVSEAHKSLHIETAQKELAEAV